MKIFITVCVFVDFYLHRVVKKLRSQKFTTILKTIRFVFIESKSENVLIIAHILNLGVFHIIKLFFFSATEYPCPTIWDGWSCFSGAKAGTIQELPCSKQAYSTESDVCLLMSEKECFSNGTWNQKTNYDVCAIAPVLRNRHNFNVIVLATTTVISFPSVVIFFTFRKFRQNLRLIFHRNLVLVIIIRNLLTIMTKEIIILDALKSTGSNNVMDNNGIACRVLAFFENAAKNGMYACMLADGFYLHKMIVRAFANEPNLLYVYAAVFGEEPISTLSRY
jgi:hypothetical protein